MKKVFLFLFVALSACVLTSCQDIKDLYNEIENMVIQESLNQLADEVGIENFELPECEDLAIEFEYNEEEDISKLELEITEPVCELSEYKDQLVGYVEDALNKYVDADLITDFEPEIIEDGYQWVYSYENTLEDGTVSEVIVNVVLKEVEGNFVLDLQLENLGDIFASIKNSIEEELEQE